MKTPNKKNRMSCVNCWHENNFYEQRPIITRVQCGNKDLRASYVAGHAILKLGE